MTRTATKPGRGKRAHDATPWSELSQKSRGQQPTKKKQNLNANRIPLGSGNNAAGTGSSFGVAAGKPNKKIDNIKMIKKIRKSESRRIKRIDFRHTDKTCFNCRKKGHTLSQCPKTNKQTEGTGICFKCGSQNHMSRFCKVKSQNKSTGAYPYATCFVCKKVGHISKDCPDNAHGLYPNGGCCLECGSVRHLRRDCPDMQKKHGITSYTLSTMSNDASADLEPTQDDEDTITKVLAAKKNSDLGGQRKVLNKRKTKYVVMT